MAFEADSHSRRMERIGKKLQKLSDERAAAFSEALEALDNFDMDEVEDGDHEREYIKSANTGLKAILAQAAIEDAARKAKKRG